VYELFIGYHYQSECVMFIVFVNLSKFLVSLFISVVVVNSVMDMEFHLQ